MTPATRYAVAAGPLTVARLDALLSEAQHHGVSPLTRCSPAEAMHIQLILKTLPAGAAWAEAADAIRAARHLAQQPSRKPS